MMSWLTAGSEWAPIASRSQGEKARWWVGCREDSRTDCIRRGMHHKLADINVHAE